MDVANDILLRGDKQANGYAMLQSARNILTDLKSAIVQKWPSVLKTVEPFWINVVGGAGMGKSALTQYLIDNRFKLAKPNGAENDSMLSVLDWNTDSSYMDGLQDDTRIIRADDIFSSVKAELNNNLALCLMKIISPSNYMPILSSLEAGIMGMKGTILRAFYLMTSGNITDFSAPNFGIADPTAH